MEKKLYATLKLILFQASKIEESLALALQVLKPETKIFSFLQLVVLYSCCFQTGEIRKWCTQPNIIDID